ncbi:hypothetical protein M0638_09100 [Roseomonas sp. NAR14]|uniref:Recombinase-like domain-containing protein n=1 Tax=Roseomonas acroporae TaxID=2937791 RepID=A0A9X1Y6R7_9PROT|nr:recombinase-like helix-turn-helix domain-containing protein [Roseomonas acroporae]MCK8784536.1 hypothetical protein [Roseomonas acroporae]
MSTYQFPALEVHQTRDHEPTEWEYSLADALESIFARGAKELPQVIEGLNNSRVRPPHGGAWTEQNFTALMQELGA